MLRRSSAAATALTAASASSSTSVSGPLVVGVGLQRRRLLSRPRPPPGTLLLQRCYAIERHYQHQRRAASSSSSNSSNSSNSSDGNQQSGVLTREFIFEALYSPKNGYFGSKGSEVICSPPEDQRIPFKTLKGYWDYQLALDKLYRSKNQAWLTPVEIFAPHYSNAIARYILATHRAEVAALNNAPNPKAAASPSPSSHDRGGNTDTDSVEPTRRGRSRRRQAWGAAPAVGASPTGSEAEAQGEGGEASLSSPPLEIYEVGGGYGTNALCILEFLKREAPQVYARTRYRIVEISGPLAAKQREQLLPRHEGVCEIVNQDGLAWARERSQMVNNRAEAQSPAAAPFILALEVLDNLPHDKIVWLPTEDGSYALHEAIVVPSEGPPANTTGGTPPPSPPAPAAAYREAHRPVQDERIAFLLRVSPELARRIDPREMKASGGLLQSVMETLKLRKPRPTAAFLPTGMAELVEGLTRAFPRRHHLLFADFDSLPPPTLKDGGEEAEAAQRQDLHALNAPLVTSRDPQTGEHVDHPSYVVNKGGADIFFPVDFRLLRDLYRYLAQRDDRTQAAATPQYQTRVVKNARFLFEYGETPETETRSGYNPLLEDFRNTCLFLASAGPGVAVNAGAGARVDVDEKMKEGK